MSEHGRLKVTVRSGVDLDALKRRRRCGRVLFCGGLAVIVASFGVNLWALSSWSTGLFPAALALLILGTVVAFIGHTLQ